MFSVHIPRIPCLLGIGFGLTAITVAQEARVLTVENIVQTTTGTGGAWTPARVDQSLRIGERIRTRHRSRATVRLTDLYTLRLEQYTTIEITRALVGIDKPRLNFTGGAGLLFSREQDGEIDIKTPAANGALRGTQLFVRVDPDGRSFFQVIEGSVELANETGKILLAAGEAGEAARGSAPRRTAVIETVNLLQWALYYPAVLETADLRLDSAGHPGLAESLRAYRSGNLLEAMRLTADHQPAGNAEALYQAGLVLAVGRVDEARHLLTSLPARHPARLAIERMIDAVQGRKRAPWPIPALATASEALAESYFRQSLADLEGARLAARRATELAPANGFAWARLAELEFAFGNHRAADSALRRALELSPHHAQAHALHGFVQAARCRIAEARSCFEHAIRLDGALGNAWLGLGLTKIKSGDLPGGRADLQTAATVEPTISLFHSYLGKALGVEG